MTSFYTIFKSESNMVSDNTVISVGWEVGKIGYRAYTAYNRRTTSQKVIVSPTIGFIPQAYALYEQRVSQRQQGVAERKQFCHSQRELEKGLFFKSLY